MESIRNLTHPLQNRIQSGRSEISGVPSFDSVVRGEKEEVELASSLKQLRLAALKAEGGETGFVERIWGFLSDRLSGASSTSKTFLCGCGGSVSPKPPVQGGGCGGSVPPSPPVHSGGCGGSLPPSPPVHSGGCGGSLPPSPSVHSGGCGGSLPPSPPVHSGGCG